MGRHLLCLIDLIGRMQTFVELMDNEVPMTFRSDRDFVVNSVVATIGVAIAEEAPDRWFHPETYSGRFIKEILLSALIAFLLGYFVYLRRSPPAALWVW